MSELNSDPKTRRQDASATGLKTSHHTLRACLLTTLLELRLEGITVDDGTVLAAGGVGYWHRCGVRPQPDDVI